MATTGIFDFLLGRGSFLTQSTGALCVGARQVHQLSPSVPLGGTVRERGS